MFGRKKIKTSYPLPTRQHLLETIGDVMVITELSFSEAMKQVAKVNGLKYQDDAFGFHKEAAIIHPNPRFRDYFWIVREDDEDLIQGLSPEQIRHYCEVGF